MGHQKVFIGDYSGPALPAAYQTVPIAPYTVEVGMILKAGEVATDRIPLQLPHPSLIVAMEATVKPVVWDPTFAAQITTDDFRCKLDLSETDVLTLRRETASSGGGIKGGTVTLSKLANDRRFFMMLLTTERPNIGFTVMSKYPSGIVEGIPKDCQIDICVYHIEMADMPLKWREEFGK